MMPVTQLVLDVERTLWMAGGVSHNDHLNEVQIHVSRWAMLLVRLGDLRAEIMPRPPYPGRDAGIGYQCEWGDYTVIPIPDDRMPWVKYNPPTMDL